MLVIQIKRSNVPSLKNKWKFYDYKPMKNKNLKIYGVADYEIKRKSNP